MDHISNLNPSDMSILEKKKKCSCSASCTLSLSLRFNKICILPSSRWLFNFILDWMVFNRKWRKIDDTFSNGFWKMFWNQADQEVFAETAEFYDKCKWYSVHFRCIKYIGNTKTTKENRNKNRCHQNKIRAKHIIVPISRKVNQLIKLNVWSIA